MSYLNATPLGNLTTNEVCALLGIEYGQLMSLYHRVDDRIVLTKKKGKLVWTPDAVAAIKPMVEQRRAKARLKQTEEARNYHAAVARLGQTAQEIRQFGQSLLTLQEALQANPPTATGFIHTLPDRTLRLVHPVGALLSPTLGGRWRASLAEAAIEAEGANREDALVGLRSALVRLYYQHKEDPHRDPLMWLTLEQLIQTEAKGTDDGDPQIESDTSDR